MHSFTPAFMGVARPWHAGLLYNRDPRFADILMASLTREEGLVIGDNEPYSVSDASDYSVPCMASDAACFTSRSRSARI